MDSRAETRTTRLFRNYPTTAHVRFLPGHRLRVEVTSSWFPEYDRSRWKESQRERHVTAGGMKFDFVLYEPT